MRAGEKTIMKDSEVCFRAAEIMSERGHCRYLLSDSSGRVCFAGALIAAYEEQPLSMANLAGTVRWNQFWKIRDMAARILDNRGEESSAAAVERGALLHIQSRAVDYNNRSDVTGEDVIMLLKETGEAFREQEDD